MEQDPLARQNFLALTAKQFEIKFNLSNSSYSPVETIGTGAYGVVCSAVHKNTGAKVAIKKIPDIFSQPTIAKRTLREIKILKHFKHDNIISIREILKPTELISSFKDIYIVLDLMESDMHRVIHSKQELSNEHVCYFLYQILRGLKYIHSANVIHRDLKPSNLLVNENCDLKIGDFGMARGVASNPDQNSYLLTQYVATRWYRAPEIMMAQLAYTGAVDVWSVGCIFAEMLGRRQLFPGRDYIDQLKLIIGIVGSPSNDFLNMIQSANMKNFIKSLGKKDPEPLKKLYPNAKNKAIDLLGKLLAMDPQKRISVDQALKHPYLNTYHDPDDEPNCIPAFDFNFETETLNNAELKEAIVEEIMDFHKPQPVSKLTFNFRPVPESELMKNQRKIKQSQDSPSVFAKEKIENKVKDNESQSKEVKPIKTELVPPAENDITMLSAQLSAAKIEEKTDVKTDQLLLPSKDVVMTSAKTEHDPPKEVDDIIALAGNVPDNKVEEVPKEEAKAVNAKEALRSVLLQAREKGVAKKSRPITALQRQRENEEKKRKKLDRAREKKKKQKEKESSMQLSTDDLQMLERWKSMQAGKSQNNQSQKPTTQAIPSNQADLEMQGQQVQYSMTTHGLHHDQHSSFNVGPASNAKQVNGNKHPPAYYGAMFAKNSQNNIILPTTSTNTSIATHPLPSSDHLFGTFVSDNKLPTSLSPSDLLYGNGTTAAAADVQPPHPLSMHAMKMHGVTAGNNNSTSSVVLVDSVAGQSLIKPPTVTCVLPQVSNNIIPHPHVKEQSVGGGAPVVSQPLEQVYVHSNQDDRQKAQLLLLSHLQQQQQQEQQQQPSIITPQRDPVLAPLPPTTTALNNPLHPDIFKHAAASNSTTGMEMPDLINFLSRQMARGRTDDLTLVHTPKGTGGGYGVGLDLDAILTESVSEPTVENRLDSAPLSASLIQDWMDMTKNLDSKDLESLQFEMGVDF